MIVVVGDVEKVGVEETGVGIVEVVEVGVAVVVVSTEAVVILEVAETSEAEEAEASPVVEVILEEVAETLEVEEVEASTVVEVEGVVEVAVLGNREGTWPFLSIFPLTLSEIQYIRRERPIDFGRPSYRRVSR